MVRVPRTKAGKGFATGYFIIYTFPWRKPPPGQCFIFYPCVTAGFSQQVLKNQMLFRETPTNKSV